MYYITGLPSIDPVYSSSDIKSMLLLIIKTQLISIHRYVSHSTYLSIQTEE